LGFSMPLTLQFSLVGSRMSVLIMLLCAAGLYVFARWASSLGDQDPSDVTRQEPAIPVPPSSAFLPPHAREALASFPPDPSLGRIRITKFFFGKLDPIPGPPDPDVFADELIVELYDPDSGHTWEQSYFVASPLGLREILRDKSWKYLYAAEMLVLPRYDLEEIRRAVVSGIVDSNELFKPSKSTEEIL
jgi:hypothetical protein